MIAIETERLRIRNFTAEDWQAQRHQAFAPNSCALQDGEQGPG